jgi:PAS domain S-box-containing protein
VSAGPDDGESPPGAQGNASRGRRDDARARAILASMLDPTISIDEMGIIQAASDSVERVFGYAPHELVGRNIKILMPEPHRSNHDGYLEHYRRTGETGIVGRTREFDVVCKDGRTIVCALSVSRADPDDGQAVFAGTFRDITELKRMTQALADSERRFHAIFDQSFEFIGLLAPDGRVLEVNQTALDSIRAARKHIVGKLFWETPWWSHSAEMRERVRLAIESAAKGEFVRFEAHHTTGSGTLYEVDFSLQPVKDETGKVVMLIPEGRNISELKRAQRTETAMLRAFATIGESAALLAHEIKNPITAVNVALRAVATELGEDHKAVLEDLIARMQRIEQMMRRTLSFAKPIQLHQCTFEAQALFDAVLSHLKPEIARTGAVVGTRVAPGGVRLLGDPALLQDVLSNLVTNAMEAKPDGVHVALVAERPKGGSVLLAVEDDGPGIPASLRESLFKPFVTTKSKGNGLGLAICRKIVEEHGGTLDLSRDHPMGARFEIRLPGKKNP